MGELRPGDRVVDLVAVARSAAVTVGLISGLIVSRYSGCSWGRVILAGFGCAVFGLVVGGIVGHAIFPAPVGQATIARVGARSVGIALKASLSAGLTVALIVSAVAYFTANSRVAGASFGIGAAVAVCMGCASVLL